MTAAIIILALTDIALAIWLIAETSPDGYEDETGFHEGRG